MIILAPDGRPAMAPIESVSNWPICAICTLRKNKAVDVGAYGIVHEADTHVIYSTSCDHGHPGHVSEQEHRVEKPSLGVGQHETSQWKKNQARNLQHTKP
jgi:hypothetical protein